MKENNVSCSSLNPTHFTSGLKILLVDDSSLMRERIVDALNALDGVGEVRVAHDVPSGVALLQDRRPDVLILDVELPGQSGLDLLRIARRRDSSMVIMVFSVHNHPTLRQKCMDLGANFFFHKLTEIDQAVDTCRKVGRQKEERGGSGEGSPVK